MVYYNYYFRLFLKIILFLVFFFNFIGLLFLGYVYFNKLDKWQVATMIPAAPRHAGRVVFDFIIDLPYLKYHFFGHGLPVYELYVKNEDIKMMNDLLIDPITHDYIITLTSDTQKKVSAKLVVAGQEYDVNAGYRGRQPDQWMWPKKSWGVIFKKSSPQGKTGFELIVPSSRIFTAEAFSFFRAKKFGLAVPDYEFVWLKLNGKDMGVYFKTDSLDKKFLDNNLLDDQSSVYQEGDYLKPLFESFDISWKRWREKSQNSDDGGKNNFASLSLLLDLVNAKQEVFDQHIWNIFDKENFLNWSVFTILAGSTHQDWLHNIRLYLDKQTNKFQMIPYNVEVWSWPSGDALFSDFNPLISRAIANHEFLLDFEKKMWNYVSNDSNLENDLVEYDRITNRVKGAFLQDTYDAVSGKQTELAFNNTRQSISNNFKTIKKILDSAEISNILSVNSEGDSSLLLFKLQNKIKSSSILELSEMRISGLPHQSGYYLETYLDQNNNGKYDIDDKRLGVFNYDEKNKKYIFTTKIDIYPDFVLPDPTQEQFKVSVVSLNTPILPKSKDIIIFIKTNVPVGLSVNDLKFDCTFTNLISGTKIISETDAYLDFRASPTMYDLEQASFSAAQFINQEPIFFINTVNEIVLSGQHVFDHNIVLPRGSKLVIEKGAKITFVNNSSFISYGTIRAVGSEEHPIDIYFGEKGGLVVIDTYDALNIFSYINFYNGGDSAVNGLEVKGSLVFSRSDSVVEHCLFSQSKASDTLSIRSASSTIAYNAFTKNVNDAVDFDGGQGLVVGNHFLNNGEDAIDLDGAVVLIKDNDIFSSKKNGINIGKSSKKVVIFNNTIWNNNVGVDIHDDSSAILINSVVVDNQVGLLLQPSRKTHVDHNTLSVYNSIIWDNKNQIENIEKMFLEIQYSDIQLLNDEKSNFSLSPKFKDSDKQNFTIMDLGDNMSFRTGGSGAVLKTYLNMDRVEVPVGLTE